MADATRLLTAEDLFSPAGQRLAVSARTGGNFVDAWLRVHPEDLAGARRFLEGFVPHLGEAGVGSISEIFDAEAPYKPRGCIAQAWSVAEVLRCWVKTAEGKASRAA